MQRSVSIHRKSSGTLSLKKKTKFYEKKNHRFSTYHHQNNDFNKPVED